MKEWEDFCDAQKVEAAVHASRAAYAEWNRAQMLSPWEFLYQQSRYVKKRWWLLQGALLALLLLGLTVADTPARMQRCMGIAAPLFAILMVPELWKNRTHSATEVECTSFYTLRQVYAARMVLFGMVDLLLLSAFFLAASRVARWGVAELVTRFFVPFNVTGCICFGNLYSRRGGSEFLAVSMSLVWSGLWMLLVWEERIFRQVSGPAWGALLALSAMFLGYCIRRGQKQCQKTWEVISLWN